jgi:endo-1,4-beta-D-glucanase Y
MTRVQKIFVYGGIAILCFALMGFFATQHLRNNATPEVPLVYSNNAMLSELWSSYKGTYLESSSGRTIDHSQPGNITTSEGQSYTMLRAVYIDDRATFDKSLLTSQQLLQRRDSLFSWKFSQLPDGKYGINISAGDNNTASDGDIEITLALLMAYNRWNDGKYLAYAQSIIRSIYNEEVVLVNGRPVLTADDIERKSETTVVINPSYFDIAAFKIFGTIDVGHNWKGLVDNSYEILKNLSLRNSGTVSSDGLPPDWIEINRVTGKVIVNAAPTLDTHYGYDAFRTPWRLALDYAWFKDPRDLTILKQYQFLSNQWSKNHELAAVYAADGTIFGNYEAPAMYGTSIGYFMLVNPKQAYEVYTSKLLTLYSPDNQGWKKKLSYYDDNWVWFGMALYQAALPNLTGINP